VLIPAEWPRRGSKSPDLASCPAGPTSPPTDAAPAINETVTLQDGLIPFPIERRGLDELEEARMVPGPTRLQGNSREMFCREHSRRCFSCLAAG